MSAKTLIIDIETAPIELMGWKLWDESFSVDQIKKDWSIFSFAAKWLGKRTVLYADTGGRGVNKVRDDKLLMKPIWNLLDEADIVVAQNGKRFDVRKMNARLIEHGFKPPSPYRVVDTMIVARKYFAFTSQKLAYTSERLTGAKKDEHKEFPGFVLWKECLADNPRAWAVMRRYNKRDILRTEGVYLKMLPWIENHPNLGAYDESERPLCPKCGSDHVTRQKRKLSVKQQGSYFQYQCQDCGGWARGKVMQMPIEKRRSLLAAA